MRSEEKDEEQGFLLCHCTIICQMTICERHRKRENIVERSFFLSFDVLSYWEMKSIKIRKYEDEKKKESQEDEYG